MNPKISEFTYEQLSLTAKTLIWKRLDLIDHIEEIKRTPFLERMFKKEITDWQSQIDDLETIITQFSYAAKQKEIERRVSFN